MKRRDMLRFVAALSPFFGAERAWSQDYPVRPVRLLVGFSAGSGTDLVARQLAEGMKSIGQPVVVENVPGAGSTLAAARAARSAADGYTLYLADFSHAIAPALYPALTYDTAADFAAIAPISRFQFVLVASQKSGLDSAERLVSVGRSQPGKLTYGSSGAGSALHLIGEVFAGRTQSKFLHVPYRGGGDVLNALLAGDIDFAFFPLPPLLAHVKSGKLRVLGIPGTVRDAALPEVPTLAEQGVRDFDAYTWNILLAPRGTPAAVISRLAPVAAQVAQSPAFVQGISTLGARPLPAMSPQDVDRFLAEQVASWGAVVKATGAKLD